MASKPFRFLDLPFELQRQTLTSAWNDPEVSIVPLLKSCRRVYELLLPIIYVDVHLRSIEQAKCFINTGNRSSSTESNPLKYTKRFRFTLVGVPGGSTRGGRESAPGSPGSANDKEEDDKKPWMSERLWVASTAISLCPALENVELEMFGVRHSTLLTSSTFLNEVANAFRQALSELPSLKTFAWITPRINYNFIGFSVAVVDLAFSPMIEGLHAAAVHMTPDQRRVKQPKGSIERRAHGLDCITLHHCIFPLSAYANESLFFLLAQTHPDDEDWLLFPSLQSIVVRTAINVDPRSVAYLLLTWQLRIDASMNARLSDVERFQRDRNPRWDPHIKLTNTYVNSIWGPAVTLERIRFDVRSLLDECKTSCDADDDVRSARISNNPYIRALEESPDTQTKLTNRWAERVRSLRHDELDTIVERACARVDVEVLANAIAGS